MFTNRSETANLASAQQERFDSLKRHVIDLYAEIRAKRPGKMNTLNTRSLRHRLVVTVFFLCLIAGTSAELSADDASLQDATGKWHGQKPNILWIMIEDWSTDLSCYGTPLVHTPNIDKLAGEGIRFERAYTTSPVCSTSRSAMMTGFHQNYIGAHQHRTKDKQPLPYGIKPIPHLLEEAGYFTATMIGGKTDCNFKTAKPLFMGNSWKERKGDQPFYVQATFGGTHRNFVRDPEHPIDADQVKLPPYYPDVPLARRDWANGLETVQVVDRQVGELLQQLEDEGLADNTIVFFIGDHGRCHIRGKQFLYEGGVRIPLIVRWPGHIKPGSVSDELVSSLDICQTIVEVAGAKPTHPLHGLYLFGEGITEREYVHFNRDKMDSTHDAMRAVRSDRYKLIHNLMPERAYCQLNEYKERQYPMLALMNVLNLQGKLNDAQAKFMADRKPEIELYDLENDPHELNNLADDPKHTAIKAELLAEIVRWRKDVKDIGVTDEFRSGGWSSKYPTKSLEEWQAELAQWEQALLVDGKASRSGKDKKKARKRK
ncbi:sulfatase family protein [Novipirellula sp. SH528]|uniref:sulfatase family protein n=1 Tax=Novipirellula sp. SH528 TaxID=3454466 RepID=UPI003FA0B237